jgi:hypothetical protein
MICVGGDRTGDSEPVDESQTEYTVLSTSHSLIVSLHKPACHTAKTKCRKFETNIPTKGISGSQSHFPHSCICERIIYSHDGSAFSAGGNMWTDPGNI